MSSTDSNKTIFQKVFATWGKERLRRRLLATLNDRLLIDVGFSPELLKQGVDAWPWRLSEVSGVPQNQPRPAVRPATPLYHGDIEYIDDTGSAGFERSTRRAA